jgi:choline/glycine/proline betaine transport protein
MEFLPATKALSVISLLMIVIFFVTSADSGAMVLNMLSAKGVDNTPALQRTLWTLVIALAASLLLLGGGLQALQTATIASALPFAIALLGAFWGFGRALLADGAKRQSHSTHVPPATAAEGWRDRLGVLLEYPDDQNVLRFQRDTVEPAMQAFAGELAARGVVAQVIADEAALSVRLEVAHGGEDDFSYEVRARNHPLPDASIAATTDTPTDNGSAPEFFRAEVHLAEGGQDYDVMGWSEEQVIVDILNQYEDHLHFLHTVR